MEMLILMYDFFRTRKWSYLASLIFPAIIGTIIVCYTSPESFNEIATDFRSNILTVIGILLGFTIALLAIFITAGIKILRIQKNICWT
ncbi:hypothetical protein MASR2M69_06870 [Bacteroidota bacterium]